MKEKEGMEVQLHTLLTSTLDEGKWSASHPGFFTARKIALGIHGIGGWVAPRTSPDILGK
jgi:hypothetical protein